jgi:hypothetical protein
MVRIRTVSAAGLLIGHTNSGGARRLPIIVNRTVHLSAQQITESDSAIYGGFRIQLSQYFGVADNYLRTIAAAIAIAATAIRNRQHLDRRQV